MSWLSHILLAAAGAIVAAGLVAVALRSPDASLRASISEARPGLNDDRSRDRVPVALRERSDAAGNSGSAARRGALAKRFARLPLAFEPNIGQSSPQVAYLARGSAFTLFLTKEGEAVVSLANAKRSRRSRVGREPRWRLPRALPPSVLRLQFVGAEAAKIAAGRRLPGRVNYLRGDDPRRWRRNVPTYRGVRQQELYPGIGIAWYSRGGQLEYDFLLEPGADPGRIRLRFGGANAVRLARNGDLALAVGRHKLRQLRPLAYQDGRSGRRRVSASYVVARDRTVRLRLGRYDRARPLVIDPVLTYSTYLGGNSSDGFSGVAVDGAGAPYLAGNTYSTDYPTAGALQSSPAGNSDALITKLTPDGSALAYSTYLGGAGDDVARGIAVDASGRAYVAGYSYSADFPTAQAYQGARNGTVDAFVAKLSPDGSALSYSTYLGGTGGDNATGLALDASGSAYVTGATTSTDFPTANPLQGSTGGGADGFVTKLTPSGGALAYSTYLGGGAADVPNAIAVDAADNAYLVGDTRSTNFPVANAFQASYAGSSGWRDAFVSKLAAGGGSLTYSTYLGGTGEDIATSIAADTSGSAYLTGSTRSTNFPTTDAIQTDRPGEDAFVTKLSPTGAPAYSTYLGGNSDDGGNGIAVDAAGSAHVTGYTISSDFPGGSSLSTDAGETWNVFASKLAPSGSALAGSLVFGGGSNDYGYAIAIADAHVVVAGSALSSNFPTVSPLQATNGGSYDAFLAKLDFAAPGPAEIAPGSNPSMPQFPVCGAAHPVICATGNFYETVSDLEIPGRGRGLDASRTYSASVAASDGPLGFGWTHSYGAKLAISATAVTVHHWNGSQTTFEKVGAVYEPPRWGRSKLAAGAGATLVLTYADQTADVFDATSGKLLKLRDRNGYETTLAYDGAGKLDTVTDPGGRTLTYAYNAGGRIASIADSAGRSVSFTYNAGGELTKATDVRGKDWLYAYDASHRMTKLTDPRGGETINVYDAQGRVSSQTDAEGGITEFAYGGDTTTVTNARGHDTVYKFEDLAPVAITRAAGTPAEATETFRYDADYDLTKRTDGLGKVTTATYDADGNRTKLVDPLLRETTATYTAKNDPATITDASGVTTTFGYDANGNLESVARPLSPTQTATTSFAYDPAKPGDLVKLTDPRGKEWRYEYDAAGNRTAAIDPLGNRATTAYDAAGRPTETVTPRGNAPGASASDYRASYAYNPAGDVTKVTDPLGRETALTYDDARNLASVRDPKGNLTQLAYDLLGRKTRVNRPASSTLEFAYDGAGNLLTYEDGLNHVTSYTYDELDRLKTETDPLGKTRSYAYDDAGRLTTATNESNQAASYVYDDAGQLTGVDFQDPQTADFAFVYDDLGGRTQMTDATGTSTFAYDDLGRLIEERNGAGHTLAYGYDLAGNLTRETYPQSLVSATAGANTVLNGGAVLRAYDDAGRMTRVTDWFGARSEFSYDRDGNLTLAEPPNGTTTWTPRDRAGRLEHAKHEVGDPPLPFLHFPYTRDANGLVGEASALGAGQADQSFDYDALDRLTGSDVGQPATAALPSNSYAYDPGDRLTRIGTSAAVDRVLAYDNANQLTQITHPTTGATLRSFQYDARGNRTRATDAAGAQTSYAWDQAGRLAGFDGPLPGAADARSYRYDADGLLDKLTWTHAEGGLANPIWDGQSLYITGPNGLPLEQISSGGVVRFYHQDALGSTRAMTGPSGAVVGKWDYDPYGNAIVQDPLASNPFLYAGQYTDSSSGFVYMRQRWYDPETAQFISRDPIGFGGGSQNLYAYVGHSPVNGVDPSGLSPWDDVEDFIAGLDNPVSEFVAGAFDGLTGGGASALFGFNGACVDGAFGAGRGTGPWLAMVVPGGGGLRIWQLLTAGGLRGATRHGAERLAQGQFTPEAIRRVMSAQTLKQADGATVHILESSPGRYDFIVESAGSVVTAHRGWSRSSVDRLARNYGWQGW